MEALSETLTINPFLPKGICRAVMNYLKEKPRALWGTVCNEAIAPLFPNKGLEYQAVAAYRALEELRNNGCIRFDVEDSVGCSGQKGRIFKYSLSDHAGI